MEKGERPGFTTDTFSHSLPRSTAMMAPCATPRLAQTPSTSSRHVKHLREQGRLGCHHEQGVVCDGAMTRLTRRVTHLCRAADCVLLLTAPGLPCWPISARLEVACGVIMHSARVRPGQRQSLGRPSSLRARARRAACDDRAPCKMPRASAAGSWGAFPQDPRRLSPMQGDASDGL